MQVRHISNTLVEFGRWIIVGEHFEELVDFLSGDRKLENINNYAAMLSGFFPLFISL